MRSNEFESLAASVYGARWQSQLSRDLGVPLRTVQRWRANGITNTASSEGVRRFLEERRVARIAPPPTGTTAADDRDEECRNAIEPGVRALIAAALDVGWDRAEVLAAVLAANLDEMRAHAGDDATRSTLQQALDQI